MSLPDQLPSFLLFHVAVLVLVLPSFSAAILTAAKNGNGTDVNNSLDLTYIRNSCGATLYPELCYQSLSRYAGAVQQNPARLAKAAMALASSRVRRLSRYLSNATRSADFGSGADPRATAALHDCSSNLDDAKGEISDSLAQMGKLTGTGGEEFRFQMSNVQTWMSAALTDEETCTDGFEDVSDGPVKAEVARRVADVKKVTSNALALVNSYVNSMTN